MIPTTPQVRCDLTGPVEMPLNQNRMNISSNRLYFYGMDTFTSFIILRWPGRFINTTKYDGDSI